MPDAVPVSSKPAGGDPVSAAKKAAAPAAMNAMSVKMAGVIRPYLDKATPALIAIGNVLAMLEPYVVAMWVYLQHVWEKLQPYHPEEMFPALAGFVLVFFGGNFFTLCAAVEAYREAKGDALVPQSHVTADGLRLGVWVKTQRKARRKGELSEARAARLEAVDGWQWRVR